MRTDSNAGPKLVGNNWLARTGRRQITVITGALIIAIVLFGLVLLSPLGLRKLSTIHGFHWNTLGNIGQAYGAAAAILSVFALIGVTAALFVQLKDVRVTHEQTARTFHSELIRMAIEDPDLRQVVGFKGDHPQAERQQLYANLWLTYWRSMYRLGYMNEKELRQGLSEETFSSVTGRRLWNASKLAYFEGATDRRTREFCRIVDDEYHKLIRAGEQIPQTPGAHSRWSSESGAQRCMIALLFVGIGALIFRALTQRQQH